MFAKFEKCVDEEYNIHIPNFVNTHLQRQRYYQIGLENDRPPENKPSFPNFSFFANPIIKCERTTMTFHTNNYLSACLEFYRKPHSVYKSVVCRSSSTPEHLRSVATMIISRNSVRRSTHYAPLARSLVAKYNLWLRCGSWASNGRRPF